MKRSGSAVWRGGLKDGKGTVSTGSGTLDATPYSFKDRFENGVGTNPEELIAAAHAACFSMALSVQLGTAGLTAESIETNAGLTMEKLEAGWTITAIQERILRAYREELERSRRPGYRPTTETDDLTNEVGAGDIPSRGQEPLKPGAPPS